MLTHTEGYSVVNIRKVKSLSSGVITTRIRVEKPGIYEIRTEWNIGKQPTTVVKALDDDTEEALELQLDYFVEQLDKVYCLKCKEHFYMEKRTLDYLNHNGFKLLCNECTIGY